MKKIYIVLTYSGTVLSKFVKMYTKREFSHVSIALDEDLKYMYSFGRLNPYNPFIGGFVHEGKDIGTFKRFKKTKARIYSLQVPAEKFDKVVNIIKNIKDNKESYSFNFIGLVCVMINLKVKTERRFYCAEFVKYVLNESNISNELPEIIKPEDFKMIEGLNFVYSGFLREYQSI